MAQTATTAENDGPMLLREDTGGVAYLTLNRPRARNALSLEMLGEMNQTLDAIKEDQSVRAVVIAGNGPSVLDTIYASFGLIQNGPIIRKPLPPAPE